MDILVAHTFYRQAGGEDQCVASEVAMLKAHGHNVVEYYLHNDAIAGMSRIAVAARSIWSAPAFCELRALLRAHRPQVVHFHNTFPLMSPSAYYAARAEDVPIVQTLHNFRLVCPNALLYRDGAVCEECLGKSFAWPAIVHKCYHDSRAASATVALMQTAHRVMGTWRNAADVYIALTEASRGKLVAGGLPAEKIAVKPNFSSIDPGRGDGAGGYGLYVGRLSTEKGVSTLLEAWRRLEGNAPLKIAGDGPMAPLVREAAAHDASIEWLGVAPLEKVYDLIGAAGFLIVPSLCYENFPRVIAEAFAKGTPVIASNMGAMAEIVDDGRTGLLFAPAGAGDLAGKVKNIRADPARLLCMREAARQEFVQKFTADANHAMLMNIYARALSAAPIGRRRAAAPAAQKI